MTSLYKILKSAKLGAGAAQDFHTAIMAQKMPFAKRSGAEHEYTGAVPVTFIAGGTPLLDYLISGNTVQSDTPTPDNPVDVVGCGVKTENLLDIEQYNTENVSKSSDGSYYAESFHKWSWCIPTEIGKAYTVSASVMNEYRNSSNLEIALCKGYRTSYTFAGDAYTMSLKNVEAYEVHKRTFIFTATDEWLTIVVYSAYIYTFMISEGSIPLPYEPYGYKIPISSAGQTTPIYLGEAETTRKIKKLVLTGEETITKAASNPVFTMQLGGSITPLSENTVTTLSTHYQAQSNTTGTGNVGDMKVCIRRGYDTMYIGDARYDNITDFKSYLAAQYANGTPVTVWYVLATPVTGIVNEPLMRIGDYADTVSHAQAGVSIPTVNGSTTLDVETAVKPSEIYIKYKS